MTWSNRIGRFVFLVAPLILASCAKGSANTTTSTPVSDQKAMGQINGQFGRFDKGNYRHEVDQKGVDHYSILLTNNETNGCDLASLGPNSVLLFAPVGLGSSSFPTSAVTFSYQNGATSQNDIASNSTINILSDNGTQLTGSVLATMNNSSINGTFTVTVCPNL